MKSLLAMSFYVEKTACKIDVKLSFHGTHFYRGWTDAITCVYVKFD